MTRLTIEIDALADARLDRFVELYADARRHVGAEHLKDWCESAAVTREQAAAALFRAGLFDAIVRVDREKRDHPTPMTAEESAASRRRAPAARRKRPDSAQMTIGDIK